KKVGNHNFNEGPDFENATIEMDGIDWIGNVEVHVSSGEWNSHKHQFNPTYNTVILHVVYQYDTEIKREDGTVLETLELMPLIDPNILDKYHSIQNSRHWIPCEKLINSVEPFYVNQWLHRVAVERLASKSTFVLSLLND